MASVNKVILVGNMGRDPEVRYMPSGDAIATLSIATTDTFNNRQTGQREELTEWHRVVFFGKTAEVAAQYLKKGSQVYVEGSIRTRKWQDKETGQDRYSTEIRGDRMQMLGGRGGASAPMDGGDDYGYGDSAPAAPAPRAMAPASTPPAAPRRMEPRPATKLDDMDDDIPF